LIKNAECVITNSFHATVFSILFNRKFFVEQLHHGANTNSRLYNLLKMLRLQHRMLKPKTVINDKFVNSDIDYEIVNLLLDSERANSKIDLVNVLTRKMENVETKVSKK